MSRRRNGKIELSMISEQCEMRILMSGTGLPVVISLDTLVLETTKPTIGSVYVSIGRDEATSTAFPRRLNFSAYWISRGRAESVSTGSPGSVIGAGDVWVKDVTEGETNVFIGTVYEFIGQSSEQLQEWLIEGHTYRIFFRETSIPLSYVPPYVGFWSAPHEFHYGKNATLAKPHDAASMAEAGLGLIPQTLTIAPDQPGDWGLETYSQRRYTAQYEIQIRNEHSGELYQSLTLNRQGTWRSPYFGGSMELASLLPSGPTPPGIYSIRMRTLEGYRETNDAEAIETWTEWSALQVFHIYVQPVVITSGGGSTLDATPTFRWKSVPDAAGYDVWIGKTGSNQPVYSRSGITRRNHTVDAPLPNGDYVVYIRARLNGGGVSQWGTGLPMSIGAPVTANVAATARAVSWARVPDATRYEIWVDYLGGTAPAGSRFIHETRWRQTTFTLPKSAPEGSYRLWIRAMRTEGKITHRSTWSRAAELTVVGNPQSNALNDIENLSGPIRRTIESDSIASNPATFLTSHLASGSGVHPENDGRLPIPETATASGESQARGNAVEITLPGECPSEAGGIAAIDDVMSCEQFPL